MSAKLISAVDAIEPPQEWTSEQLAKMKTSSGRGETPEPSAAGDSKAAKLAAAIAREKDAAAAAKEPAPA